MKVTTLGDMRDRVKFLGDFPNSRKFTVAILNREINNSIEDTYNLLLAARPDYYLLEQTPAPSTTPNSDTVALAPNFYRLRKVEINFGEPRYRRLDLLNLNETHKVTVTALRPRWYRFQGSTLRLYPTPTQAWQMRIFYHAAFLDLVADADTFDTINGFEEHAIVATVYRLKMREQMPAGEWGAELQRQEQLVRTNAADLDSGQPFYLSGGEHDDDDDWWHR